jgi:hypothetical protein
MKESLIHVHQPVITNDQSTEVLQPDKCSFNRPATLITPYFVTIMVLHLLVVLAIWTDQINAAFSQPIPKRITVIRLVCDNAIRIFPRTSSAQTRDSNVFDSPFQQLYLTRRGRIEMSTERDSLAIDHHHPLRTFSTFGLTDARTPFFADAKLPSANVSSHSSCFCSSRSDRNLRHIRSQTPCSSHCCKRRQQVLAEGYCSGRSFHRAPLRRTHTMPSKTSRLPFGLRPPFGDFLCLGSKDSSFFHCSSVTNCSCLAIGAPFLMTKHT